MTRASPIIFSTNAGELSPTLDGRVDLSKYTSGCKRLENFLPLVQGPAVRRGGSRFVHAIKNEADRTWLIKFEFSATQCFYLEFGNIYVRFYTDHGILESAPAVPYEIVSPYALADLTSADGSCALRFVQSGDVLYIANKSRTYAPRKLTRVANTNWVFSTYDPSNGPFLPGDTSTGVVTATAVTGAVTVTSTNNVFAATDVGRLIRIEAQEFSTKPWETAKAYGVGNLVRFDGKTYRAINAATSGSAPPTHERGKAYDGLTGVQWEYINSGYGVVRITAFTDPANVNGTVVTDEDSGLKELPVEVILVGTSRVQLGAWSQTTEYPSAVTFFRNRLWWAGQLRLWGSVPDDFENMAADFFNEVSADNAINRIVTGQDVNDIEWISGADKLVVGTGGGEFACGELSSSEALSPENFAVVPQSARRVRGIQPVTVGSALLYVQRAGQKLLGLNFSLDIDRYASSDLTLLADRVTRSGIVQMAYQSEPYSINWCALGNGKLLGFTYEQAQEVTGWHNHPLGGSGIVDSVAVGPAPDGGRDEVWMIVKRTINGATHRYVEFFERPWEGELEDGTAGDDQADAFYVDSGLTYDGAPTAAISGLGHLEGMTVQILADGARQPDKTVSAGAITLDTAASVVHVGLQYVSRLVPMRLEAGSSDGTAQGKIKRVSEAIVRFFETLGGKCGRYGETLDELSLRDPSTPMGSPSPIFSGDVKVDFTGDYDRDAFIEIVQDEPLPMTVIAIMPKVRTYG